MIRMGLGRMLAGGMLRYFTTDQAVRAGVITAAWAGAASFSRGMLPRTAVQQAAITGVSVTSYYALGTTTWATVSSVAAGLPGSRPGPRARLVAASSTAVGGKLSEMALRSSSGDSLARGIEWSEVKLLSVVGLAGGLVTVSDLLAHEVFNRRRTPGTTLALDLAMGSLMAGGTLARRLRRARRYGDGQPPAGVLKKAKAGTAIAVRARTAAVAGATVVGSTVGLAILATTEQALARLIARAVTRSRVRMSGSSATSSATA